MFPLPSWVLASDLRIKKSLYIKLETPPPVSLNLAGQILFLSAICVTKLELESLSVPANVNCKELSSPHPL